MTALAAEVLWTRLLSLLFGATVYTFSLILGVFLFGLGIGSSVGAAIARSCARSARRARLVPDAAVRRDGVGGLHADALAAVLADQPVDHARSPGSTSSSTSCAASGSCCPARFSGARASRWRSPRSPTPGQDPGRLVGGVYAANTVGADRRVASARACRHRDLDIGTQHAQQVLIVISALSALMMLAPAAAGDAGDARAWRWGVDASLLVVATGLAGLLARSVPTCPGSSSPTAATPRRGSA